MATTLIRGFGAYDEVKAQVDPTHFALRTSIRPLEYGQGGAYNLFAQTGTIAAGAGAASFIFEFRWASPLFVAVLKLIKLSVINITTAFAAGTFLFDAVRLTQFTAIDATGATALTIKGKDQTRATRMSPTQLQTALGFGGISISATAPMTAGTKTADSNAFAGLQGHTGGTPAIGDALVGTVGSQGVGARAASPTVLWDGTQPGRMPQLYDLNEGFGIRATVPATGTWIAGVEIDWEEFLKGTF